MVANLSDVSRAKESLARCLKDAAFLDRFYDGFLASSPEVRAKLQHMNRSYQIVMLKSSLHIMMAMTSGGMGQQQAMIDLAEVHSRRARDIKPELYAFWLEAMIDAVRKTDPAFGPEVEQAWRVALQPGIDYMIARY